MKSKIGIKKNKKINEKPYEIGFKKPVSLTDDNMEED